MFDIFTQNISRFTKKVLETGVNRTNNDYGALDPETTNVLYVHGSIDPWHALGLTESKNPNTPTIFIKGLLDFSKFLDCVTTIFTCRYRTLRKYVRTGAN